MRKLMSMILGVFAYRALAKNGPRDHRKAMG